MNQPDFYAVLNVPQDADAGQLQQAYRRLVRTCHPDAAPNDPAAAALFLAVSAAYGVLHDPARRAAYDGQRRLARAANANGPAPSPSTVGSWVVAVSQTEAVPRQGDDVALALDIPDSLARTGGQLLLNLGPGAACPACRGTGNRLRTCWVCDGRGSIWQPAGPGRAARACPACNGQGVARSPCPACLGRGRNDQPRRGSLIIAPGTPDGAQLRVCGAGQPGTGGRPAGDLLVTIRLFPALASDWAV
ncbi:DnaJ domain-containing protein [Desulfovibrio sp. TomC]|uniref:DnaJ domain-containing protein n=1 Tax=Desulfovibrio sp. TomC TaxID=1562888 RepID=UPI0012E1C9DD|nr:DnaJ domain-containing protein [Desulfovibrio sp. TomC]